MPANLLKTRRIQRDFLWHGGSWVQIASLTPTYLGVPPGVLRVPQGLAGDFIVRNRDVSFVSGSIH
jgi:hypothetical protein